MLIAVERAQIPQCAEAYISAYGEMPWSEVYEHGEVERYISAFCGSDARCCFAWEEDGRIVGVALGLIVPDMEGSYLRIEDFCIAAEQQRRGAGSAFMSEILGAARERGWNSALLGTQRNYPSHLFYRKNGFSEIDSVLLYREIPAK